MRGKPFEPGQIANPAGRPLGARNRLNKALIEDLYAEWKEGGRAALKIMRIEEPAQFVKCALATLPRELLIESIETELADDELEAALETLVTRQRALEQQAMPLLELKAETNGKEETVASKVAAAAVERKRHSRRATARDDRPAPGREVTKARSPE
jgi:hypothetical protein